MNLAQMVVELSRNNQKVFTPDGRTDGHTDTDRQGQQK